jgi:outer membrane protein OmpA-like peptidoglycan-associated protein
MKKLVSAFAGFLFLFTVDFGTAEVFRFKYHKNDTYRILSTVYEDVKINGKFDHHAEIVNRVGVVITETVGERARHEGRFMTTETRDATSAELRFDWGEEYESVFTRDQYGKYTISDQYFMPTVRDVPLFPEADIPVGGTWEARGEEAHDLRRTFNVRQPYKVPFNAHYQYTGTETTEDNRTLHVITVTYTMEFVSPRPASGARNLEYPTQTTGYSNQTIFWDNDKGNIDHYYEDFRIVIKTSLGNVFEFTGTAHAEVTDYVSRIEEAAEDVQVQIDLSGLDDVTLAADDRGLTLRIENLNFVEDSAILLPGGQETLDKIVELLKLYPDNDLLVSGHAARAGSVEMQRKVSEMRAHAITDYLIEHGVRDAHRIFTRWFGAEKPVASNNTEAGRIKNRRVEITIMDK